MDAVLDHITLKRKYPKSLDEDSVRYELRTRGYKLDRTDRQVMREVACRGCGKVGLKFEVWKVPHTTKRKQDWVTYTFAYCSDCWAVGVHG